MEMMTNTNNNFDMQTLMNIVGQSAMTTNQISQQLGIMANSVNTMRNDINGLKNDMEQIKLNEEITTTQQENIIEIARHRVCDILNFNDDDIHMYLKTFITRLYADTRDKAGLGSKIARTKKGDYQRVIDYIEAWIPECGCAELKLKADKRAESRRKAKELGYDC